MQQEEIEKKFKEIVIARLRSTPPNFGIVIGSEGYEDKIFSSSDLIEEIHADTQLGKDYVELEVDFLRSLKEGVLYG